MRDNEMDTRIKQRGSATIEAVVAFTGFLLVFFTLLGVVNYCRAQMRISAAVDTAARELAQYAYFYDMSGLQKYDLAVGKAADKGADRINEVVGTVDDLYKTISKAADNTAENQTNFQNAIEGGNLPVDEFKTLMGGIKEDGENILESMESMEAMFEQVADNPMMYVRSIAAIATSEGSKWVKKAIAVPLSKAFVLKHFGDNYEEQDATLKALGIVDGVEGLNFKLSNIFNDDDKQEIQIVVFYKVKLSQFFDWEELEVPVSKQAVCGAWLGGDVVPTIPAAAAEDGGADGGADGDAGDEG